MFSRDRAARDRRATLHGVVFDILAARAAAALRPACSTPLDPVSARIGAQRGGRCRDAGTDAIDGQRQPGQGEGFAGNLLNDAECVHLRLRDGFGEVVDGGARRALRFEQSDPVPAEVTEIAAFELDTRLGGTTTVRLREAMRFANASVPAHLLTTNTRAPHLGTWATYSRRSGTLRLSHLDPHQLCAISSLSLHCTRGSVTESDPNCYAVLGRDYRLLKRQQKMVGVAGFEPATPASRTDFSARRPLILFGFS